MLPILQVRILEHREVKCIAPGHNHKWQNQGEESAERKENLFMGV